MASSVPSYVNFQSSGTSSHLTRYTDGSFLTVWTSFDRTGAAYVYGKSFKADGTVLRDTFLIDSAPASAAASYSKVTATTLSDGRTAVAWLKSDGTDSVVGKVLGAGLVGSSALFTMSEETVTSEGPPQIFALTNGGFSVFYRGDLPGTNGTQAQMANYLNQENGVWVPDHYRVDYEEGLDPASSIALGSGKLVNLFAYVQQDGLHIEADVITLNSTDVRTAFIDIIPGVSEGISVTASPLSNDRFVVAWEDVEGAGRVIRAQIFDSAGSAIGGTVSFTKPNGTLEGTPVIKPLANGGFAIAFVIDVGNDDENIYTAAVDTYGTIITNTIYVGTSTAGDQWEPSLIALNGNNYAVSWMSDTSTGQQFFVEVIGVAGTGGGGPGEPPPPPPPPSTTWTGTEGNDAYTGSALSETFYSLGGRDSIRAGGGNDTVDGGSGNDTIWGGAGNDVLTSGGGFDVFVFDTKPNKSTNKDKITDFSNLFDSIWLENKVFSKLGKKGSEKKPAMIKKDFFALEKAKDKDDYIIYSKKKATIYYDADGSGSKVKAVEIATVKKGTTVTYADFYVI